LFDTRTVFQYTLLNTPADLQGPATLRRSASTQLSCITRTRLAWRADGGGGRRSRGCTAVVVRGRDALTAPAPAGPDPPQQWRSNEFCSAAAERSCSGGTTNGRSHLRLCNCRCGTCRRRDKGRSVSHRADRLMREFTDPLHPVMACMPRSRPSDVSTTVRCSPRFRGIPGSVLAKFSPSLTFFQQNNHKQHHRLFRSGFPHWRELDERLARPAPPLRTLKQRDRWSRRAPLDSTAFARTTDGTCFSRMCFNACVPFAREIFRRARAAPRDSGRRPPSPPKVRRVSSTSLGNSRPARIVDRSQGYAC